MAAVNVEGFMGGLNRFLYGAGGGDVAASALGRRSGRMAARVAGRFNAMRGIARSGGAIGVIEAMGRPVGNAALQGMMIGAAGNAALQVYGNVTSGRNAFAGIPGAAIRGGIAGGLAGGAYGISNAFMGAPKRLARTTLSEGYARAMGKARTGFMGTGPRNWDDLDRYYVSRGANAKRQMAMSEARGGYSAAGWVGGGGTTGGGISMIPQRARTGAVGGGGATGGWINMMGGASWTRRVGRAGGQAAVSAQSARIASAQAYQAGISLMDEPISASVMSQMAGGRRGGINMSNVRRVTPPAPPAAAAALNRDARRASVMQGMLG